MVSLLHRATIKIHTTSAAQVPVHWALTVMATPATDTDVVGLSLWATIRIR